MVLRWSFSLSLVFVGLAHYMQFESFKAMVSGGLGPIGVLGLLWAYVLPALMIIGGVSLSESMPAAINAFIWLLVFLKAAKSSGCCSKGMCADGSCDGKMCPGCGKSPCRCK